MLCEVQWLSKYALYCNLILSDELMLVRLSSMTPPPEVPISTTRVSNFALTGKVSSRGFLEKQEYICKLVMY